MNLGLPPVERQFATVLDAALAYVDAGLPVFPLFGVGEHGTCGCGRASCDSPGKHPHWELARHGLDDATTDPATVENWFAGQAHNIGVRTGNGIVVIDLDTPEAVRQFHRGVSTLTVRTARGAHVYYRTDQPIRSRTGLQPGLDVKSERGYVVGAGSIHHTGARYEITTPFPINPMPSSIRAIFNGNNNTEGVADPTLTLQHIAEGERNSVLFKAACVMRRAGFTAQAILAALTIQNAAACQPPLADAEVRRIAENVAARYQPDRAALSVSGFTFTTVGELLAEPEEEKQWLVDRTLPTEGFGVLVGKPKAGKSTLARQLAYCIARGIPWLGKRTMQGPVIYLALEEKRVEVKRHFRALGATTDDPILIHCATAPGDALARLREVAEEKRPVLIIPDPLFRLVRVRDGNDYAGMTAALEPVLKIARETGAAILAVHHLGKGAHSGTDAILGSTAIFGAVDTALLLKRTDRYRTLSSVQRYGDDLEDVVVNLDTVTRTVSLGRPRAELDAERIEEEIASYLKKRGEPVTEEEILRAVEGRHTLKVAALRNLLAGSRIGRVGAGRKGAPFLYSGFLVPAAHENPGSAENPHGDAPNSRSHARSHAPSGHEGREREFGPSKPPRTAA